MKRAKEAGVRAVASAGGGRPVRRARRVRAQRRRVKMPRREPRVERRVENCSATAIMAVGWEGGRVSFESFCGRGEGRGGGSGSGSGMGDGGLGDRVWLTEEAAVCGHVRALQHLGKPSKCTHDTFDDLKGRLRALAECVRQAVGILPHARLAWISAHASVHASHPAVHAAVAAHTTHTAVHAVAHSAKTRVGR